MPETRTTDRGAETRHRVLRTGSRVKVWWLVQFRGYRVVTAALEPRQRFLGGIRYDGHWWLAPGAPGRGVARDLGPNESG